MAFTSTEVNLFGTPDGNGSTTDVVLRDERNVLNRTLLVSLASSGAATNGPSGAPNLSASGRYVALRGLREHERRRARANFRPGPPGGYRHPHLPPTGVDGGEQRALVERIHRPGGLPRGLRSRRQRPGDGDTNPFTDHYVAARDGSGLKRVSVRSDGSQTELASPADPAVSGGGREIAFASDDETVVVRRQQPGLRRVRARPGLIPAGTQ